MIEVLDTGFYSTVQDLGRFGFRSFGVPVSGAMDTFSAELANRLLGNDKNEAVLEMTMKGARLKFHSETFICITGADMQARVNGEPVSINAVVKVNEGDELSFEKLKLGFRAYLALSGGFQTETVYGSKSMYQGITKSHLILKNDKLSINSYDKVQSQKHASIKLSEEHFQTNTLEVYKGPEFDLLTQDQKRIPFDTEFSISKDNNRMAYQLNEKLTNNLESIITSAVLPGTVQLTPNGSLIVLMRDCQTTGGYPRILQLSEMSINRLAQKYTNHKIRFILINQTI